MIDNFEFEDKFNPWTVTSLDDFLFYCCPECDDRSVTKSEFVQHAVKNHPRSQNIIDSLHSDLFQSVVESENNSTDENQSPNNQDFSEDMEFEETKPEFTTSSFVAKVNHEIIKVESNDSRVPLTKLAVVSLPKLSDKIIKKYTKETEIEPKEYSTQLCHTGVESSDSCSDDEGWNPRQSFTSFDINECKKSTSSTHVENVHEKVRHNCDKCDKVFSSKLGLNSHVKSVHENVRYNCNMCEKIYPQKSALQRHIKRTHEKVRYYCDKCDKCFVEKNRLKTHIASVHENIHLYCDKCGKSFTEKKTLNSHIAFVHENRQYYCDKCGKSFSQKSYLNTHIQSVHENVRQVRQNLYI